MDDEAMQSILSQEYTLRFLDSNFFTTFITLLILLNTLSIGAETNILWSVVYGRWFRALDRFFMTVFALEIGVKWYAGFGAFWRVGWNWFDFGLVAASLFAPGEWVFWWCGWWALLLRDEEFLMVSFTTSTLYRYPRS